MRSWRDGREINGGLINGGLINGNAALNGEN